MYKNGHLRVVNANNNDATRYMREENQDIGEEKFKIAYEKETQKAHELDRLDWEKQRKYLCLNCHK